MTTPQPSGTVTFLFTDIEGSTALWEARPEAMKLMLARHDQLLRETLEAHCGHVFKTMGDAFCVAFGSARAAAQAAVEAQRALSREDWGEVPLRVRMCLHTGEARERDGDYFGPPLNRVARLLGIAHGGQLLLSSATVRLLDGGLPEGVLLTDLGEHRLRDLLQPEPVWQLHDAAGRSTFPPLRSLDARPHNLPVQRTSFVGRTEEVAAVATRLRRQDVRLLTLTGPGGTGKTRLSLQAAAEVLGDFADGVWFVPLADTTDPARVLGEIAQALHVGENPHEPLMRSVLRRLGNQRLLLLIDNFEQVVEAAPVVGELLAGAPELKVMVTSRELLRLYGEHNHPVPPLALPDLQRPTSPAELAGYDAVSLFLLRAQAARADFAIDGSNAQAVAGICVRLDGLPLAIELAAARLAMFSPAQLLQRLSERLKTVASNLRDLPSRQRTLRGAIDWSHSLLPAAEQRFFARVSVFEGGFDLDAAESVCGQGLEMPAEDVLQSLIDKSLLRANTGRDGALRYGLLPTLHEYAGERLQASGERDAVRDTHADHFGAFAARADADAWWKGGTHPVLLEELNCAQAADWSLSNGDPTRAAPLVDGLCRVWRESGRAAELRRWSDRMLAAPGELAPSWRGRFLTWTAEAQWLLGDLDAARQAATESLEIARAIGDRRLSLRALYPAVGSTLGAAAWFAQGARWLDEWQAVAVSLESSFDLCRAHGWRGEFYRSHGRLEAAQAEYEQALVLGRQHGYPAVEAIIQGNIARIYIEQGRSREALAAARAALAVSEVLGMGGSGDTLDKFPLIASAFEGLAEAEVAARVLGAHAAILERRGEVMQPQDLPCHELILARVRNILPPGQFEALFAEGSTLSAAQALALAKTIQGP